VTKLAAFILIKLGRFPARPDLNEAILEPDDLDE
jgi:hypothetical protein